MRSRNSACTALAGAHTRRYIGEELGSTGTAARQWVIDPIDGTQNFVRGVPVWATLIALLDQGEPVMGLVSAPGFTATVVGCAGYRRLRR